MKILLAEDNVITATLMRGILTRHGYTVVLARNGTEALSLLATEPGIKGVITDVMMPESSGLDVLRALREDKSRCDLPTIVTTVRDDKETVAEAVRLGCRGYILKPIRPSRLIETIMSVFGQERAILTHAAEVIERYSLNAEAYARIAKNFLVQVDQAIASLQSWEVDSPPVSRDQFIPIVEGATLLGADRLLAVMEEVSPASGSAQMTQDECTDIIEKLRQVRDALSEQIDRPRK